MRGIAWNNKGRILLELNPAEKALRCFDRAIEIESNYEKAWSNKGLALQARGLDEKAIDCAALASLDRFNEAVECFGRVIEINPQNANAWYNKGLAFSKISGRTDDAIMCFEEAYRLGSSEAARVIAALQQVIASRKPPAV